MEPRALSELLISFITSLRNLSSVEFGNGLHPAELSHILCNERSNSLSSGSRRPFSKLEVGALKVPLSVQVEVWLMALSLGSVGHQVVCGHLSAFLSNIEVAFAQICFSLGVYCRLQGLSVSFVVEGSLGHCVNTARVVGV